MPIQTTYSNARETLADLWREVEIIRTEHGVPHIRAENLRAGGYALGWLQWVDPDGHELRSPLVLAPVDLAYDRQAKEVRLQAAADDPAEVNPSLTYMAFTARAANYAVEQMKKPVPELFLMTWPRLTDVFLTAVQLGVLTESARNSP